MLWRGVLSRLPALRIRAKCSECDAAAIVELHGEGALLNTKVAEDPSSHVRNGIVGQRNVAPHEGVFDVPQILGQIAGKPDVDDALVLVRKLDLLHLV